MSVNPAAKESEISKVVSEMAGAIEKIEKSMEDLDIRFTKVLSSNLPPAEEAKQPLDCQTELGSIINGLNNRLINIDSKIRSIVRRCEL